MRIVALQREVFVAEAENVVRIMSIHKAKGLEFPVVFVPQLGKRINFKSTTGDILADRHLGLGVSAVDLEKRDVFARGDRLALRIAQPLRVERGGVRLNLPVGYDYATLAPTYAASTFALTPSGRELVGELAWRGALWGGDAAASVFWRKDPGHVASLPEDKGVAVKWTRGF